MPQILEVKMTDKITGKEYILRYNHPIPNTFGIKANACVYGEYHSEKGLCELLDIHKNEYIHLPILHTGDGSNLLFLDNYHGMVIRSAIRTIDKLRIQDDEILVRVGGGVNFDDFVAQAVRQGWYGLENLSLIPGQVGACAVQNIGAYGVEAKDVIYKVEGISFADGSSHSWTITECDYDYRQSIFKKQLKGKYAITYVTFRLQNKFKPRLAYGGIMRAITQAGYNAEKLTAEQLREVIINVRREKLPDPNEQGSAGSFFMNPIISRSAFIALSSLYPTMPHYDVNLEQVKIPAGWLIEQCGWKGRALGEAAVHHNQALVLVNRGNATGSEILQLSNAIRHDVLQKFGIVLQPEVNFIGCLSSESEKCQQ